MKFVEVNGYSSVLDHDCSMCNKVVDGDLSMTIPFVGYGKTTYLFICHNCKPDYDKIEKSIYTVYSDKVAFLQKNKNI